MTRFALTLSTLVALAAAPAFAQTTVEDTDGDGSYSMEELQAAYPDLTAETFGEIDADDDDLVSEEELTAAREAGLIDA